MQEEIIIFYSNQNAHPGCYIHNTSAMIASGLLQVSIVHGDFLGILG